MEWTPDDGLRAVERMQKRASCRNFETREIPDELLRGIIGAGLCAASGGNLQPFSIIKITGAEDREKLCEANGGQRFIAQAPVNLLFLLDWHKMGVFAETQEAPFTCHDSFMHFLIGLEDVMCAVQSIETAAHLAGLGSCYVGTVNTCAGLLIPLFNLPRYTYPVVLLSLGYPAKPLEIRKKLAYDVMVFDGAYPDLSVEAIHAGYYAKYGDARMKLPADGGRREETLREYEAALLTTYPPEKTAELLEKARETGAINETQRRFGLHYNAKEMREEGYKVIEMFGAQGLTPFRAGEREAAGKNTRRQS